MSAVVQDALRGLERSRLRSEFRELQGYWSTRARAAGIVSRRDLERLLRRWKVVFDTNIFVSALAIPGK